MTISNYSSFKLAVALPLLTLLLCFSNSVERHEFKRYVKIPNLANNHPGIQAMGLSLIVTSASIGAIVLSGGEGRKDDMMKCANVAMYEANDTGCNEIKLYGV